MVVKQQKWKRKCCSLRTALFRSTYIILNLELFHLYNFFVDPVNILDDKECGKEC